MKYQDTGFRALYHHYAVFPLDIASDVAKRFPSYDQADCILTYGYIDHTAGFTLEVLALGARHDYGYGFYEGMWMVR